MVVSLVYIDRLLMKHPDIVLTFNNAKGLILTALFLANKFYDDRYENNTLFHAIGSVSKRKLRQMSDAFLDLIEFNLNVQDW